jgi:hypothetical protein
MFSIILKRGVTRRGVFERRALSRESAHKGWWPFAYTLLDDLERQYTESDEPLLERLYRSMAAGNSVNKITRRERFTEVDSRLAMELDCRYPVNEPVVIHDMAASNAITSLELFNTLVARRRVILHATDYFDALFIVTLKNSPWTVVFDVDHNPLQIVGYGLVISARRGELLRHPVNRVVQALLSQTVLPHASATLTAAARMSANSVDSGESQVRKIRLFHPLCVAAARTTQNFRIGRHDLFQANPIRCHVVRVMNALTIHNFSAEQIQRAIKACVSDLIPGGLLILGRSADEEDERPRVTAFEWSGKTLTPVWDHNGGYESSGLVLSLKSFDKAITTA